MWEGPQSVWTLGGITGSQRRNSIHWRLSPFSLLLALGETSFQMFPAQQLEESLFQLGCSDKCTLCGNLRISPLKVFPFHCSTGVWWFCFCFCFCLFLFSLESLTFRKGITQGRRFLHTPLTFFYVVGFWVPFCLISLIKFDKMRFLPGYTSSYIKVVTLLWFTYPVLSSFFSEIVSS